MKRTLISIGLILAGLGSVHAAEEVTSWSCQESRQFKTSGTAEKIQLTWESRTYEMSRENSSISKPSTILYSPFSQTTG